MDFDAFIQAGWKDHGDHPDEVANRLETSLHLVGSPEQVPVFSHLLTHVFGEHLGEWQRGITLLEHLRVLPVVTGDSPVAAAVARSVAALRYGSGDTSALDSLSNENKISALAVAASALSGRKDFVRAIDAYAEALRLAASGLPDGSPAHRSLAIGGNSLASSLEEKPDRSAFETDGMLTAAKGGLTYWKIAGTWLEEERAEYRLTRSLLQAGQPAEAIEAAERCVAVCATNSAPAFECFFGHAVLALAHRAAGNSAAFEAARAEASRCYEAVPADERVWCETERKELGL